MISKVTRALVIGPTGAGKSQFCNFVRRDASNSINKVSDSLESCTQEPFSNFFERQSTNYEFIDTAGSSDSSDGDIENLEKLICYLRKKQNIDYVILLFKFGERVSGDTKKYIKFFGKIFTGKEFYYHLCVVFTKYPYQPTKKEEDMKQKHGKEIDKIIKETFNIDKEQKLSDLFVSFVDTDADVDRERYEENQKVIDGMLKIMKIKIKDIGPLNTNNLDLTGKRIEEERKNENKFIEAFNKKQLAIEEEKKQLQFEVEKKNLQEEIKKEKQKRLQEINKEQEEQLKKIQDLYKKNEEKVEKMQELLEELKKQGVKIEKLDRIIDGCGDVAKKSLAGIGVGGVLLVGACIIGHIICPASIIADIFGFGGYAVAGLSSLSLMGSGAVAGVSKIRKYNI